MFDKRHIIKIFSIRRIHNLLTVSRLFNYFLLRNTVKKTCYLAFCLLMALPVTSNAAEYVVPNDIYSSGPWGNFIGPGCFWAESGPGISSKERQLICGPYRVASWKWTGTHKYSGCKVTTFSGYKFTGGCPTAMLIQKAGYNTTPSTPSLKLASTDNNGSYNVSWSNPTHATSFTWQERFNNGSWSTYTTTSTVVNRSGRANGSWRYRVRACQSSACSSYSGEKTVRVAITPPVPSSISVPEQSDGSKTISWSVVNVGGAVGPYSHFFYELEEKVSSGGSYRKVKETTGLSHTLNSNSINQFYYRVRACRFTSGYKSCSGYRTSSVVNAHPPSGAPSLSGSSTSSNGSYSFSWSTNIPLVTKYNISEKVNNGSWSVVSTTSSNSYSRSGRSSGQYYYKVQPCNYTGCGSYSAEKRIDVAHKPGVPTSITQVSSDMKSTKISWGKSSGTVSYYVVEQSKNGGSYSKVYQSGSLTHTVPSLKAGKYKSRVKACNNKGSYTNCSSWRTSSDITLALLGAGLTAPTKDSNGSYSISFTKPANGNSVTYLWQERLNNGSWSTENSTTSTSVSRSGKANGVYGYRVRAKEGSLYTSYTSEKKVTVAHTPGVPSNITLPALSDGFVEVKWGGFIKYDRAYRCKCLLSSIS
ncbi:hypothetical protein [Colwellia sp. E2M01]|uniref:hypothetical protein n=1 Tax=Colwellia sp. E2M01 TaxID=2841561 RepID=UPI001C08162B|nr:hypothetical protein [Colwellia sp. E2M01]MBU2870416.1 hypothetical protein [Colwellia sp. E2M01]